MKRHIVILAERTAQITQWGKGCLKIDSDKGKTSYTMVVGQDQVKQALSHPANTANPSVKELFALSEDEQARRAQLIIEHFGLKKNKAGRSGYPGNDKTELGLFRTLLRFIADGE
jgi:hypothetical protein